MEPSKDDSAKKKEKKEKEGGRERRSRIRVRDDVASVSTHSAEGRGVGIPALLRADDRTRRRIRHGMEDRIKEESHLQAFGLDDQGHDSAEYERTENNTGAVGDELLLHRFEAPRDVGSKMS